MKKLTNKLKALTLALCCWPMMAMAADQSVTIQVEGMTCAVCVTAINKALRSLPEVRKAKASLPKNQAVVIVPEGYKLETLLAAIEETGYHGTISSVQPVSTPAS